MEETVANTDESYGTRVVGNYDQYRALSSTTPVLVRGDKERYIRLLSEDIRGY